MEHIYIGSDGTHKDVRTMPEPYLLNAAKKMRTKLAERMPLSERNICEENLHNLDAEILRRKLS